MRIEQITFSRFIAAISIVILHFGTDVPPFNSSIISGLFENASVGVSYFFILSGFVMVIAYGRKEVNASSYFLNRVARIYPVYLLGILILLAYFLLRKLPVDLPGLATNLFVVQAWIPSYAMSFNGPGWSLTVEFLFYILFPFLLNVVYKKWGYKKIILSVLLFWFFSQLFFYVMEFPDLYSPGSIKRYNLFYYFPLMHLNEFLIGNLAGLFFLKNQHKLIRNYDWLIVLIFLVTVICLKVAPMGLNIHNGFLALLFVPLILAISLNNGLLTTIFKKKIFVFLGEISYSIYILQIPISKWTESIFYHLHMDNGIVNFYAFCVLLILFSAFSYKFLETPLREKIKSIKLKKIF